MRKPVIMRILIPAILILTALWMYGCTSGGEVRREPPPEPLEPGDISVADTLDLSLTGFVGVDTAVAREATRAARYVMVGSVADSISDEFFERAEKVRQQGHPLVELYERGSVLPDVPPDPADTLRAFEITLDVDEQIVAVEDILGEPVYVLSMAELDRIRPAIRERAASHLEAARDFLQEALTYNPWDNWSRIRLIEVLEDLAKLHQSLDNLDKAIEQTEILFGTNQSDYLTSLHLGDRYMMKGDSLAALRSYRQSEDLLLTWAPISQYNTGDQLRRRVQLDSLEYQDWLFLVREQMFLEQDLMMGNDLISNANRLQAMSRPGVDDDTVYAATARDMLKWIGWDEGNIYSASARIPIIQMINEGSHEEARASIRGIRDDLVSETAQLEMDTLAAVLDFGYLDEPEAALERLRNMLVGVGYTEVDSSLDTLLFRNGIDGFGVLMTSQRDMLPVQMERVLELYGTFATIYANRLEKNDRTREKAFVYYYQSALLPHKDQAFALMALSNMSQQDPSRAVRYGEAALSTSLPSQLAPTDKRILYELMVTAYRNLNDLNRAEHYFHLLEETG
jgi:hypothetical protein